MMTVLEQVTRRICRRRRPTWHAMPWVCFVIMERGGWVRVHRRLTELG